MARERDDICTHLQRAVSHEKKLISRYKCAHSNFLLVFCRTHVFADKKLKYAQL